MSGASKEEAEADQKMLERYTAAGTTASWARAHSPSSSPSVPVAAVVVESDSSEMKEVGVYVGSNSVTVVFIGEDGREDRYELRRVDIVVVRIRTLGREVEIHVKEFGALKFTVPRHSWTKCTDVLRRIITH